MVKVIELKSLSFSKKCKNEIVALLPQTVSIKKQHAGSAGYVLYVKNEDGYTIAHAVRENSKIKLLVKENA